ncbi:hypothetical protein L9F63_000770 [Diploptera punctata]|uniref:BROMI middle region domain-containing protein n=1 Tax=Diploptera punctata TaxID=6984 RepID=A0AAD8ALR2_DIPPU|nr:hypothetical protein L9F63_000770 [Diploptera punctata]
MMNSTERKQSSIQSNMMHLVQESIKDRLDGLISVEVERTRDITPQTWKITAHNITKTIKESSAMNSLLYDTQSLVTSSVEHLISNIENEPISELSKNKTLVHIPLNEVLLQGNCDVNPMHYEHIAENTSQHKCLKIRKQALNAFIQFVPTEVVTNQYWPQIRRNLMENLCEENNEIFSLTLKIHAKLLQSASLLCIREGFINLIEGIHLYYSNLYHTSLPNFKQGIDLTNVIHDHLIKMYYLLLENAKEMPKNWLRYGERRVEEIVGVFIDLLAMHTYCSKLNLNKDIMYPYHILSILDPKANWCKLWVHGAFGHRILLNILSQNKTLIGYLIEEIILYMNLQENENIEIFNKTKYQLTL